MKKWPLTTDLFLLISELIADIDYDFVVFNGVNIDDPRSENQDVASLSYMNEKEGIELSLRVLNTNGIELLKKSL